MVTRLLLLVLSTLVVVSTASISWAQGSAYQHGNVQQHAANASQNGPEQVLIILDASYSMTEPLTPGVKNGESKMSVAKRTILQVLNRVPPSTNLGLRVYGARTDSAAFACRDSYLAVPIGANQRYRISSALSSIQPKGATPISHSLIEATEDDFLNRPGKKTIILVSDGIETCGQDPCSVAVNMQRRGIDVKISVVGFGLHDLAAMNQLKCIALSTFGQFHLANTAAQLADQLGRTIDASTEVQGRILLPPRQTAPNNSPPPPAIPKVKEIEYRM